MAETSTRATGKWAQAGIPHKGWVSLRAVHNPAQTTADSRSPTISSGPEGRCPLGSLNSSRALIVGTHDPHCEINLPRRFLDRATASLRPSSPQTPTVPYTRQRGTEKQFPALPTGGPCILPTCSLRHEGRYARFEPCGCPILAWGWAVGSVQMRNAS